MEFAWHARKWFKATKVTRARDTVLVVLPCEVRLKQAMGYAKAFKGVRVYKKGR